MIAEGSIRDRIASLTHAIRDLPLAVIVNNPLGVPIGLQSLSFIARYKGQPFGTASVDFTQTAAKQVTVAPGTPKRPGQATGHCTVKVAQTLDKLVRQFLEARGRLDLEVQLQAGVEIQGFKIPVFEYTQAKLPLIIKGLESVQKMLWLLPKLG